LTKNQKIGQLQITRARKKEAPLPSYQKKMKKKKKRKKKKRFPPPSSFSPFLSTPQTDKKKKILLPLSPILFHS
jgi:hypothetical protein